MAIFNQIYNRKNGNGNKIFKYIKFRFQFSLNPIHSAYSDSDCTSLMWEHRGVVLIDYGSALSEGPKNEVCCPAGGPAPPPRVTPNVWIWPNLGKCPPDARLPIMGLLVHIAMSTPITLDFLCSWIWPWAQKICSWSQSCARPSLWFSLGMT